MTEDETRRGSRRARATGATVAIALGLAAALYVTLAPQGNDPQAAQCAATVEAAAALDPLIGGEVAAFRIADAPSFLGDLGFEGPDGAATTLGDAAAGVSLVNIWATWCAPCREEMPALDRLEAAKGGEDFRVVAVSIDIGGREKAEAFLQSIGVQHLELYTDPTTDVFNRLKEKGLALGLPVSILVDDSGCQIGRMNGPAEWDSPEGQRLIEAAIETVRPRG